VEEMLTVRGSQPLNERISRASKLAPGLGELEPSLNGLSCRVPKYCSESRDGQRIPDVHMGGNFTII